MNAGARQIPVDAYRRGNEFTVLFDLPGVDSRFIELTVGEGSAHREGDAAGSALRAIRSTSPNGPG